jgi:putative transcriptional regulator
MSRLGFLLLVVVAGASLHGQERLAPAKGMFLVARNEIDGGPFHESVVLLLAHNDQGSLGLIVNRATEIPLAKALPDLVENTPHELYFGGPVELSGLMYLFRSDDVPEDADHVMGDVYYSGDRELLEELMEANTEHDRLLLFIGHAGWAPGQLDGELVRGSWDVVRADAFTVFGKDPSTMWQELSKDSRVIARARSLRPSPPSSRSAPAEAR